MNKSTALVNTNAIPDDKAKNPKVISSVGLFYKSMSVLEKVLPVRFKNWLIYKIYG